MGVMHRAALRLIMQQAELHVRFAGFSHLMMNDDECEGRMKFDPTSRPETVRNLPSHFIAWSVAI